MADGRGPKGLGKNVKICVKEEFKIAVKIALDKFRLDETQKGNLFVLFLKLYYYLRLDFSLSFHRFSSFNYLTQLLETIKQ